MQRDLFDDDDDTRHMTRTGDPGTSHEAADSVAPKLKKIQIMVDAMHRKYPHGLTDWELDEVMGGNHERSTYRTRRAELTRYGLIVNSGHVRHQHGSNRIVWVHTAHLVVRP
jgi:hypothetical protein